MNTFPKKSSTSFYQRSTLILLVTIPNEQYQCPQYSIWHHTHAHVNWMLSS